MHKISEKILKCMTDAMKNWKVELTAEGKTLAEMKIQRSISESDALSPLFVITMMPLK